MCVLHRRHVPKLFQAYAFKLLCEEEVRCGSAHYFAGLAQLEPGLHFLQHWPVPNVHSAHKHLVHCAQDF